MVDQRGPAWTQTDDLLADVVEEMRAANWLFIKAHVKEGTHVPLPDPVPRSHVVPAAEEPAPPAMATAGDLAAFVGADTAGRVTYTPADQP